MRRPVRDVHTLQMHTVCHAELAICILCSHLSGFPGCNGPQWYQWVCRKESLYAGRNMVWWHSRVDHPAPHAQNRGAACVRQEAGGRQQLATPCAPFLRQISRGGRAAPQLRHNFMPWRCKGQKVAAVQRAGRGRHAAASLPHPAWTASKCIASFDYGAASMEPPLGMAGLRIHLSRVLRTDEV